MAASWADRIGALRQKYGWTYRDAGLILGTAPSTVYNIEHRRSRPQMRVQHAIQQCEAKIQSTPDHVGYSMTTTLQDDFVRIVLRRMIGERIIGVGEGVGRTVPLAFWSAWRDLPNANGERLSRPDRLRSL